MHLGTSPEVQNNVVKVPIFPINGQSYKNAFFFNKSEGIYLKILKFY